jgi:hypothetical protein
MRRDALESRADRGMRAYVTGSDDARDARLRARYDLAPHRVGELDGSWHTSGATASRSTHRDRRRSRGGAQGKPATPALLCRHYGYSGGNAQGSGWRDGSRRFDGDARRKHAHKQSHHFRYAQGCT